MGEQRRITTDKHRKDRNPRIVVFLHVITRYHAAYTSIGGVITSYDMQKDHNAGVAVFSVFVGGYATLFAHSVLKLRRQGL